MEAYTSFASVYDIFMDNVPYEEWGEYLRGLLEEYGAESGLVVELGCGTGAMTEILAGYGYDMIGVDNSEEMLELAMDKKLASGHDILYLLQDMREFELYGTVRAAVSVCDSVNYITEPEAIILTRAGYLFLILTQIINTGRYSGSRRSRRTAETAASYGITAIMRMSGSMSMT